MEVKQSELEPVIILIMRNSNVAGSGITGYVTMLALLFERQRACKHIFPTLVTPQMHGSPTVSALSVDCYSLAKHCAASTQYSLPSDLTHTCS